MASNLNPKTAAFTTTGVLLGAEQYPSTVQQAVAGNTGFCLFAPRCLTSNTTEYRITEGDGTQSAGVLMSGGIYDIYSRVYIGGAGTYEIQIDGTTVYSGTETGVKIGTLAAYTNDSLSWQIITLTGNSAASTLVIYNWEVFATQYA